jgi:tetratricopeptide (TPR) repeat protein
MGSRTEKKYPRVSTKLADPDRHTVPRWRPSWVTIHLSELASLRAAQETQPAISPGLVELVTAWEHHRTISFASDLVGGAFAAGRPELATDAAHDVLEAGGRASPLAQALAARILHPVEPWEVVPPDVDREARQLRIHRLRKRLHVQPRNPLMWVDLAREYTILAQMKRAESALSMARRLAPDDRFVLRSAARFYLHWEKEDQAHDLLQRTPRIRNDPWLLASEIAAATLAGRTSRFVRRSRELITSRRVLPVHTAELASAVATLELEAGNNRASRRLFEQSLRDPNENAVAQATWAARRLSSFEVDVRHLEHPFSYEASAWRYFIDGEWDAAIEAARRWQLDEPFASRPAVFGSFMASVVTEDFRSAIEFAVRGLATEPDEPTLLNNLAYAYACADELDQARTAYEAIGRAKLDLSLEIAYLATGGLIAFRQGRLEEGRRLYHSAVEKASRTEFREQRILGLVFHAREEIKHDQRRAVQLLGAAAVAVDELGGAMVRPLQRVYQRVARELTESGGAAPPLRAPQIVFKGLDRGVR